MAESFERIHRSNLVGMGIIPLEFKNGENRESLNLTGTEKLSILNIRQSKEKDDIDLLITYQNGNIKKTKLLSRIDTKNELENFLNGGVLRSVVKKILESK